MSAKLKLFLILILSTFATTGAGAYMIHHQPIQVVGNNQEQKPQLSLAQQQSPDILNYPERSDYKTIPLESLNSTLQGSDPATLALNAVDETATTTGTRQVEVVYPQRNQALVTITQIKRANNNIVGAIKYRVEMTTFGRSLFVSSPPVWQIIWAGSQVQCWPGSQPHKSVKQSCH
jgi:hypothetical protein